MLDHTTDDRTSAAASPSTLKDFISEDFDNNSMQAENYFEHIYETLPSMDQLSLQDKSTPSHTKPAGREACLENSSPADRNRPREKSKQGSSTLNFKKFNIVNFPHFGNNNKSDADLVVKKFANKKYKNVQFFSLFCVYYGFFMETGEWGRRWGAEISLGFTIKVHLKLYFVTFYCTKHILFLSNLSTFKCFNLSGSRKGFFPLIFVVLVFFPFYIFYIKK